MHSIWRRLIYYAIGLGIGLIIITIFFGSRGCNWLPENRIKASIFSQILVLDTTDLSLNFPHEDYVNLISEGSVNLSLSVRKGEPKAYYFSNDKSFKEERCAQVIFETDGVVGIVKPLTKEQKSSAHIDDLWLPIIHVPGDSNFINFHNDVLSDVTYFGLSRKVVYEALKNSGKARTIPYDKDPEQRNIHAFQFEARGKSFLARARVFKNTLELLFIREM
jgi:hypothetical protein